MNNSDYLSKSCTFGSVNGQAETDTSQVVFRFHSTFFALISLNSVVLLSLISFLDF